VSEAKSPYYHGIVLLQLYGADIGCNNENLCPGTIPEHPSSSSVLSVVCVALSVVFCVMLGRYVCTFSFGLCVACPSGQQIPKW
jgi:hypothetical protein